MTYGYLNRKHCTLTGIVVDRNLTVVKFHVILYHRKAKTATAIGRNLLPFHLIESFEGMLLVFIRDAHTRIRHFYLQKIFCLRGFCCLGHQLNGNIYTSVVFRKLIGIGKEDVHHFFNLIIIKRHHQRFQG